MKPHGWICHACGLKARGKPLPEWACATYHLDTCFICKRKVSCTETRDFGIANLTKKQIKDRIKAYDFITKTAKD